jgi:hypothetical protein
LGTLLRLGKRQRVPVGIEEVGQPDAIFARYDDYVAIKARSDGLQVLTSRFDVRNPEGQSRSSRAKAGFRPLQPDRHTVDG